MAKTAIKLALETAEIETPYRSGLEVKIAAQLDAAGVKYDYENLIVPYAVPARTAKYKADFPIRDTNIVIEGKGHFGANNFGRRFSNMKDTSAKERQKFALLKEQHPELDIRFVFSRASAPIYKGSKTTHAKWAEDHGFKWAEKVVPPGWIEDILEQQKSKRRK
jgi:hypothetical protein